MRLLRTHKICIVTECQISNIARVRTDKLLTKFMTV